MSKVSKPHSVSQAPGWVKDVSPEDAYLAGFDDGVDSLEEQLEAAREAVRDLAQLVPPDRWSLIRPATDEILSSLYAGDWYPASGSGVAAGKQRAESYPTSNQDKEPK